MAPNSLKSCPIVHYTIYTLYNYSLLENNILILISQQHSTGVQYLSITGDLYLQTVPDDFSTNLPFTKMVKYRPAVFSTMRKQYSQIPTEEGLHFS